MPCAVRHLHNKHYNDHGDYHYDHDHEFDCHNEHYHDNDHPNAAVDHRAVRDGAARDGAVCNHDLEAKHLDRHNHNHNHHSR